MSKQTPRPAVRKKEDGVHDLEQQFVLRLPPGTAMALRHDVEQGTMNLKDKLFIEMQPDMRHGKVTYGGQIMNAKLVDLPTIIECLKTTDQKNLYKTADICQMLICGMDDEDDSDVVEPNQAKRKDNKDKKYQYPHGITPPLKNVRKRRFRKTLKKKYQEQPDIEKEVKQLFRMDNEAIDVKWEVVVEEEKPENQAGGDKQVLAQGASNIMDDDEMQPTPGKPSTATEHEIFGDVSSSDEDDNNDRDVNVMDSEGDDTNMSFPRVDTKDSLASMAFDDSNMGVGDDGDLENKLQELKQQIEDLRVQRDALQMRIYDSGEDSQDPSGQSELQEVIQAEQRKQQEYEILKSMLTQA